MKALKQMVTWTTAVVVVIVLSACSKTSNNGSSAPVASTPTSTTTTTTYTCTLVNGQEVDQNGNACQVCPTTGTYTTVINGQTVQQPCTPGQYVAPYPYGQTAQTGGGCAWANQYYAVWLQQHGATYIPMILQGQYVCVNTYYLTWSQDAYNQYYSYQNYYQDYPPYSDDDGYGCNLSFGISYDNFSGSVCF